MLIELPPSENTDMATEPRRDSPHSPPSPPADTLGFQMTEADFHQALGEVERRIGSKIDEVGAELHAVGTSVKVMEGKMDNLGKVEEKLTGLEAKQQELLVWKAGFEGQKAERDKNADNNAAMWRRVAGGLIVALIIAVMGAGIGMYVQFNQNVAIQQQLIQLSGPASP